MPRIKASYPHAEARGLIRTFLNYSAFPKSLRIICVFDTEISRKKALDEKMAELFSQWIQTALSKQNIQLKSVRQHVHLDSEEACERQHDGNWAKRIAQH